MTRGRGKEPLSNESRMSTAEQTSASPPAICVLIPVHNQGEYPFRALASAVRVRRLALLEVGLFDERMDHEEDWDLGFRLHQRYGLSAFATTWAPVCYYWIRRAERRPKHREAQVDGLPVRDYFRQRYGATPRD